MNVFTGTLLLAWFLPFLSSVPNYLSKLMATALIIEDEVDLCRLLSLHLATLGIQNEFVHSIKEAKCLIGDNMYDLIFLDMNLVDGYGGEVLTHIMTKNSEQKVIVVSASDAERERALEHGAMLFMAKPFTRRNIEHVVRVVLNDK